MANLLKLPARNDDGDVHVVVETRRGSAAKMEYDPELQAFTLSKALILGLTYPYGWGFIPSTKGEDGDPVDVLVLHDTDARDLPKQVRHEIEKSSRPTSWKI